MPWGAELRSPHAGAEPRRGSRFLPGTRLDPDPAGGIPTDLGAGLGLIFPESQVNPSLCEVRIQPFTEVWRSLRMGKSLHGVLGQIPVPAPCQCLPVAPIPPGMGGMQGQSVLGVGARGRVGPFPSQTGLASTLQRFVSLLFFPPQLVGFLINSQISFGHGSWGWKSSA